jgi:hypothetical protein
VDQVLYNFQMAQLKETEWKEARKGV